MSTKSAIPKALKHISGLKRAPLFEPGVYFLLQGEEVVYIGQSTQPTVRIGQHLTEGVKVFNDAFVQHVPEAALNQVETMFIRMMKPKYNMNEGPGGWQQNHEQLRTSHLVERLLKSIDRPHQPQPTSSPASLQVNDSQKLLRLPEVERLTGMKKSTIYKLIQEGRFPQPIKVTPRLSAWPGAKVNAWIEQAIAGTCAQEA